MKKFEIEVAWWVRIKPEYRDIPMWEFVSMDSLFSEKEKGKWEMNKLLWIRNKINNKIYFPWTYSKKKGYQIISIEGEKSVHRLAGLLFLINDDPVHKTQVDHIDKNRGHLELSNLRWLTPSENNKNRNKQKDTTVYNKFEKEDVEFKNPIERIPRRNLSEREKNGIKAAIQLRGGLYKGFRYKKVNIEIEEYERHFGKPDPNGWFQSEFPHVRVNTAGYLEINGNLSLGTLNENGFFISPTTGEIIVDGYRTTNIGGRSEAVSRFIYRTITGYVFKPGDEIDHLDTIKCHNAFSNLHLCTGENAHSDNMNNPLTKAKLSKAVSQIDPDNGVILNTFLSAEEAGKFFGRKTGSKIIDSCRYKKDLTAGFLWSYSGEEKERWEKYIGKVEKSPGYWTLERCLKVSKLYNNRWNFQLGEKGAYAAAIRNEWIDILYPNKRREITKEDVIKLAKSCKTKTQLFKKDCSAYRHAVRHKYIDELFPKK